MSKNVIIIGGPTASGKSALAIDLAKAFDGVVVNADASQVYQHIPIISAAPSNVEKQEIEHCLYGYLDESVNGNVFMWLNNAVDCVHKIWNKGKTPVFVGGSGLYIQNLVQGTTPIPETPQNIRAEVAEEIQKYGLQHIYNHLCKKDEASAKMLNSNDKTRICRAYEILLSTGKSIADWYKEPMLQKLPEANFYNISVLPKKSDLDARCASRFSIMLKNGAIEEVKYLLSRNLSASLPAMTAKGVQELASFIKGEISLETAEEQAIVHTRQYAKRQLTWFRHKFNADIILPECYLGQTDFINCVKKQYK